MPSVDLLQRPAMRSQAHAFRAADGWGLLLVDGSRIHKVSDRIAGLLRSVSGADSPEAAADLLRALGLSSEPVIGDAVPRSVPVRAFSLAIAQKCNLGCTYCYADGGEFGGAAKAMPESIALASVRRLFEGVQDGEVIKLAFLGGEPLINREGIRKATELAVELGRETGTPVYFAITSNGTLLTEDDAEFFARHGFSVTISLDGVGAGHDRLRPYKGGQGSFARIAARLQPLFERCDRLSLAARVTVTPRNLDLVETLEGLSALGFDSVGFSPMLKSPTGRDQMEGADFDLLLTQMIACGDLFQASLRRGEHNAFANLAAALAELHRGTHRPYPCGAGGGYLGVSADGALAACHRFVGDTAGQFGSVAAGVDAKAQEAWLAERHVDRQEPCRSCWARYLCGGGCHHEVIHRGRPACDYIRDWLDYCLASYVGLITDCPQWFEAQLDEA